MLNERTATDALELLEENFPEPSHLRLRPGSPAAERADAFTEGYAAAVKLLSDHVDHWSNA